MSARTAPVRNPNDFRIIAEQLRARPESPLWSALADLFDRIADVRTTIFVMQGAGLIDGRLTIDAFAEEDALLAAISVESNASDPEVSA